jgi:hypothetical protein
MSRFRPQLVLAVPSAAAERKVVPLRSSRADAAIAPVRANGAPARETSWRDLVRLLTKNLARR